MYERNLLVSGPPFDFALNGKKQNRNYRRFDERLTRLDLAGNDGRRRFNHQVVTHRLGSNHLSLLLSPFVPHPQCEIAGAIYLLSPHTPFISPRSLCRGVRARDCVDKRKKALPRIKVISSKPRIPAGVDGG